MDMALQASSFKDIGTGTGIRNKSSPDSEIYRKNFNSYEKMNEQDMDLDGAGKMEQLILFDKVFETLLNFLVTEIICNIQLNRS